MTQGSTASIKDMGFLTRRRPPPPAGHCVTTASLEGCTLASPELERFPDQPGKKAGAGFQADKTRRGTEQTWGRARLPGDWAV